MLNAQLGGDKGLVKFLLDHKFNPSERLSPGSLMSDGLKEVEEELRDQSKSNMEAYYGALLSKDTPDAVFNTIAAAVRDNAKDFDSSIEVINALYRHYGWKDIAPTTMKVVDMDKVAMAMRLKLQGDDTGAFKSAQKGVGVGTNPFATLANWFGAYRELTAEQLNIAKYSQTS